MDRMLFDIPKSRRNTNSSKWSVAENELPMSMADMDFETAPAIKQAFADRIAQGIFGYTDVPEDWADSYVDWWKERHHFTMERNWLVYSAGVISTISSAVRKFTAPAEKILILTPAYNIFFNSVINNGRYVIQCSLRNQDGVYSINFEDLEEKLADPQVSMMILCNPHNPVGKIWERDVLIRIADLCKSHGVFVLSDEIHCDIVDPGKEYIPFASVSEIAADISITCIAPTKAFNLAGVQTSAVMSANPVLRHRIWRALNTDEVGEPNMLGAIAPAVAFRFGAEWLDFLRIYTYENKEFVRQYIAEHVKNVSVTPSEATYLLWLDCRKICGDSDRLTRFLRKTTGLILNNGAVYGDSGNGFLRINLACPRCVVEDGIQRFEQGINAFSQ